MQLHRRDEELGVELDLAGGLSSWREKVPIPDRVSNLLTAHVVNAQKGDPVQAELDSLAMKRMRRV